MDIHHEEPTGPNDPNRGMNVKVYMAMVFAAAVLIAVVLLIAVRVKGSKAMPVPTQKTSPTSELTPLAIPHLTPSLPQSIASLRSGRITLT
jgi:hypothetical protein